MREPFAEKSFEKNGRHWLAIAVLSLCTIAVFGSTIGYEFSWDDEAFLKNSPEIAKLSNISKVFVGDYWSMVNTPFPGQGGNLFYRPLPLAVMIVERWAFGSNPIGFRMVHSSLHLLNAILVFLLVRRSLKNNSKLFGPFISATLFALLPYSVDTVLFLTSICDMMAFCFSTLALLSFWVWLDRGKPEFLFCVAITSSAAMLSKENAVLLPVALFAFCLMRQDKSIRERAIAGLVTSFAISVVYLSLRTCAVGLVPRAPLFDLVKSIPAYVAVAVRWAVFPFPLVLEDPVSVGSDSIACWMGLLGMAGCAIATPIFLRRSPQIAAGILLWIAFLLPSFVSIPWTGSFAPRFLYLPALGISLIVGHASSRAVRTIAKSAISTVVVLIAVASVDRSTAWQSTETLWSVELGHRHDSVTALMNIGTILVEKGSYDRAFSLEKKAAQEAEKKGRYCQAGYAYYNAAQISRNHLRNLVAAMELYQKSVQICPDEAFHSWLGAASVHMLDGDFRKAEMAARQAEKIEPEHPDVLTILATSLTRQRKFSEALECLERLQRNLSGDPNRLVDAKKRIDAVRLLMRFPTPEDSPTADKQFP